MPTYNSAYPGSLIDSALGSALYTRINVKAQPYGASGGGVFDDKAAIQAALNAAVSGSTIVFPPGIYKVSGAINIPAGVNNLTIEGYGATILSGMADPGATSPTAPSLTTSTILTNSVSTILNAVTPSGNIAVGDQVINLSSTTGVQVGDILYVATTKGDPANSGYKLGALRLVTAVGGSTLTLDKGFDGALNIAGDSVTATVVRPTKYLTLRGITLQLPIGYHQACAQLTYMTNLTVQDCSFLGGGNNYLGMVCSNTIHARISNCYFWEFQDSDTLTYGYGCAISGHNIRVIDSDFIRNKHGFTCGSNLYTSKDLWCKQCYATDPQLAAIEAHGSCERVHFLDNTVVDVCRTWSSCGIWMRSRNSEARRNHIFAFGGTPVGGSTGLTLLEEAILNCSVADNEISGFVYGIKVQTDANGSNIALKNNFILNGLAGGIGIYLSSLVDDLEISGNVITYLGYGIQTQGGEGTRIRHNVIRGLAGSTGYGIVLGNTDPGSPGYNTAVLEGNFISTPATNTGMQVRVTNLYAKVGVLHNHYDTGDTTSALVYLYGNANQLQLVQYGNVNVRLTLQDASLPVVGTWSTTRTDVNSAASITDLVAKSSFLRLTGSTATTLHGIVSQNDGTRITLFNITGQNLTVKNESGTEGTTTNRITTMTGADVATTGNGAAEFIYDRGSLRWICLYVTP